MELELNDKIIVQYKDYLYLAKITEIPMESASDILFKFEIESEDNNKFIDYAYYFGVRGYIATENEVKILDLIKSGRVTLRCPPQTIHRS